MKGSLLYISFLISLQVKLQLQFLLIWWPQGREEGKNLSQTYQKKCPAYHKYPMTKPVLQWVTRCNNFLLLRTESAKGFQAHTVIWEVQVTSAIQPCLSLHWPRQRGAKVSLQLTESRPAVTTCCLLSTRCDSPAQHGGTSAFYVPIAGKDLVFNNEGPVSCFKFHLQRCGSSAFGRYCACQPGREDFPFLVKHLRADRALPY